VIILGLHLIIIKQLFKNMMKTSNGMKNNNLYIIAGAAVLIFALIYIVNSGSSGVSAGILEPTQNNFDFGEISMAEGLVHTDFVLKNTSAEPVMVKKVYTSCMCTEAFLRGAEGEEIGPFGMPGHKGLKQWANLKVAPGEEVILKAVFDPTAHGPDAVGPIKRIIYIETNSQSNPKLELVFTGRVIK
jgi:hypothetical protein